MKRLMAVAVLCATFITTFSQKKFKIHGTVTGMADKTPIFLDDLTDGTFKYLDSAIIINGTFTFSGSTKATAVKAAIRTKDFTDRVYFWLEGATIHFSATKGKFREAKIKGSRTQEEQYAFEALLKNASDIKQTTIAFIQGHPHSLISSELLSIYSTTWGKDTTAMLYRILSNKIKNTFYGNKILEYLTLNKNLKIGDKYADFSQLDIKGDLVKLSDFTNKVLLLEFWGSWCIPCRQEHPELLNLYQEFKEKGFEIIGIAADTKKVQWIEAVQKDRLTWPNLSDLNGDSNKAALMYGVSRYPTNFLIDKNGIIIAKDIRGKELTLKLQQLLP